MKRVLDDIKVEVIGDTTWRLLESFEYNVGSRGSSEIIVVPAGFETDFASIPKLFHNLINPTGRIKPAALVHDYLYSLHGILPDRVYTRKRCDQIFLEIMEVVKQPFWQRRSAYQAVRFFGGFYWKKKK